MQKTAYELRISDWSSDVCSSDLRVALGYAPVAVDPALFRRLVVLRGGRGAVGGEHVRAVGVVLAAPEQRRLRQAQHLAHAHHRRRLGQADAPAEAGAVGQIGHQGRGDAALAARSEARRVGKECVRPGRSRWAPQHYKKTKSTN